MKDDGARRILVYGVTGSGKSTLAARIARATGTPYHSVDDLTFEADWKPVSDDRQREIIGAITGSEAWILDSGYAKWLDLVLARADLIVCLDYRGPLIFGRLLRRTVGRIFDQRPICNGNRESLRMALGRDSILLWFFKSYRRKRARMRAWEADPPCPMLRFTRPRDTEAWLAGLSRR